jgi:hypothetical protein
MEPRAESLCCFWVARGFAARYEIKGLNEWMDIQKHCICFLVEVNVCRKTNAAVARSVDLGLATRFAPCDAGFISFSQTWPSGYETLKVSCQITIKWLTI